MLKSSILSFSEPIILKKIFFFYSENCLQLYSIYWVCFSFFLGNANNAFFYPYPRSLPHIPGHGPRILVVLTSMLSEQGVWVGRVGQLCLARKVLSGTEETKVRVG